METLLKRILTGMIILLVLIVAVAGFYSASMGGMDHGTTAAVDHLESNQKVDNQKLDSKNNGAVITEKPGEAGQQPTGQQPTGQQPTGQQPVTGGAGAPPVIIQVQPPKTDPGIYIDQMKEKLRSINETNSSIASSSGGHTEPQQNGQAVTPQDDMNQLHQNFYKLGKDIATMEQSLDKLSASVRENQGSLPQQFSYTYPYTASPYNTNPYNNYPNGNFQFPTNQYNPNQQGQTIQPGQGQQFGSTNQDGTATDNSAHAGMTGSQVNHGFSVGSMINAGSAKTLFSFILLGSVVLAIISVVGFVASLFKKEGQDRPGFNNNTSV